MNSLGSDHLVRIDHLENAVKCLTDSVKHLIDSVLRLNGRLSDVESKLLAQTAPFISTCKDNRDLRFCGSCAWKNLTAG